MEVGFVLNVGVNKELITYSVTAVATNEEVEKHSISTRIFKYN